MARPEMRLVLRNKETKEYVDCGAVWPCRFEGEEFPKGITMGNDGGSNPVTQKQVGEMISSGDYYMDMREVSAPKPKTDGEDW